ncbi:hypothetical protein [Deinococcus sp. Leaf326]|uniref:hypothetical protein n=1 Tax=Deinococcus sp. Leaf326 TaxID=1736338 RepID=UPI0006FA0C50|nr:hypothetical protein [Deinococcus sp. Leaf326]KQR22874.1 hypothetical protein ASF71_06825 [Deinococcus sp. Leaf326]
MLTPSSYPAFNAYPVTGPATGPTRATNDQVTGVKVTLIGPDFLVAIQISNAVSDGSKPDHLFTPPDTSWETYVTVSPGDQPENISAPVRYVRTVLLSGTLTGGNIAESKTQGGQYGSQADTRQIAGGIVDAATARLQFATLAVAASVPLITGQTVIVQDQYQGGTFTVVARETADNVITFDAAANLTLRRNISGLVLNAQWGGARPGGTPAANTLGIQRALNCAAARGIASVYLPGGDYSHDGTLNHPPGIVFYSDQGAATLRTTQDIKQLQCANNGQVHKDIVLRGIRFWREQVVTTVPQIEYWDTTFLKIQGVDVYNYEWVTNAQGIPTTTYYGSVAGIHIRSSGTAECYGALVQVGVLSGASLWIQASDSRVMGGYFYGHSRDYSLMLDAPNIQVDDLDVIPSASNAGTGNGGIWCTANANDFYIGAGVRIDGSYENIPSGWGITVNGSRGRIGALHAYWCARGAIRLQGGARVVIASGATFADNNRINWPGKTGQAADTFSYPDIFIDNSSFCEKGETIHYMAEARDRAGGGGLAPAIRESGTSDYNTYGTTRITGNYAGAIGLVGVNSRMTGRVLDQNNKLNRSSGTALVTSSGNVIVPHGLFAPPERVLLTMMQTPAAGQRVFVSGQDGVNLVIGAEPAPASGQTLKVAWAAWVAGAE